MKINAIAFSFTTAFLALVQISSFAKHSPIHSDSCRICMPMSKSNCVFQKDILQKTFKKKAVKWSQKLNKQRGKDGKDLLCLSLVLACALIIWIGFYIPVFGGIVSAIGLLLGLGFLFSCLLIRTLACGPRPYRLNEMDNN